RAESADCRSGFVWSRWPSLGRAAAVPKLFQAGEEGFGLGMSARAAGAFELAQQILLLPGQLDRGLDRQLHVKIAALTAAQDRHALGLQPELAAGLGAFGNGDLGAAAIQGRNFDAAAEGRGDKTDRRAAMQIMAIALEDGMRGH